MGPGGPHRGDRHDRGDSNTTSATPTPSALASLPADTPQAVGIIVAIDSSSLTDVRSFTLRTTDGQQLKFGLAELQNGTQFPPGHLAEHQATAQAVRVFYRDANGTLQAIRLEDAHPYLSRDPDPDSALVREHSPPT